MKIYWMILLCLLLIPGVSAIYNYTQVGGTDPIYQAGVGFFNEGLSDDCGVGELGCSTVAVPNPAMIPLVADLDGDGVNEIVQFDGTNIELYQGSSLTVVDALSVGLTIRHGALFDIDGDGYTEVIVAGLDNIFIVEYNGTDTWQQATFSGFPDYTDGTDVMLACGAVNNCLLVYNTRTAACTPCTPQSMIKAMAFNSTHAGTAATMHTESNNHQACLPDVRTMAFNDYDNDGTDEYSFTYMGVNAGSLYLDHARVNASANSAHDDGNQYSTNDLEHIAGTRCQQGAQGERFSSPLVFDADGASSNGYESIVALMIDADEFNLYVVDRTGTKIDQHPTLTDGEGRLISGVMRANVFRDGDDIAEDYCAMGYEAQGGISAPVINLICGSQVNTNAGISTTDFTMSITGYAFNVTRGYNTITHAAQMKSTATDGGNLHEFVNAYGVLEVDYSGDNHLDQVWENEKGDSAVIPVDPERVDRDDLLVLDSTNLWYMDDGWTDSPGFISYYYIDPCHSNTWKLNTTVEVRMIVTDVDGDAVNASAVLYEGTSFNQTSAWVSGAAGTTFTFLFEANHTIGAGVLELRGYDVDNPGAIDTLTFNFGVADVGVEWGSGCVTEEYVTAPGVDPAPVPPAVNETTKEDLRNLLSPVDSSLQPLVALIFIIVITVSVALVLAKQGIRDGAVLLYIPMALMFVMWMFFAWLGMLPGWTVIIGLVFASAIIGWKVYSGRSSPGFYG